MGRALGIGIVCVFAWGSACGFGDDGGLLDASVVAMETHQSVSIAATADSGVKKLAPDQRFGYEPALDVRSGAARGLVRFDTTAIVAAGVVAPVSSASVELTVARTALGDPSDRALALHRLERGWVEAGATWRCADDSNVENFDPDCAGQDTWDLEAGGDNPWLSVPTATAIIPELAVGESATLAFDVSADIVDVVAGSPNHGWVIVESGTTGLLPIAITSRETQTPPALEVSYASAEPPPEPVDPVELGAVAVDADTYIRPGLQKNRNFGAETALELASLTRHRVLLHVDTAALEALLASATLGRADLELDVTDVSAGWGAGGSISLHRLTQSFDELGATWSCADDQNTSNFQADCDPADVWEMGIAGPAPWDPEATAVAIVDAATTAVSLEITGDVAAILDGGANHGWILKRASELSLGSVDFASRETASGPRVVLASGCQPESDTELCARLGATCGEITETDNCGAPRTVTCGDCLVPETCGGGGQPNTCGCTPTTCAATSAECGDLADGCGGVLDCGSCDAPDSCGGGGAPNTCGCTPTTCAAAGADCGTLSNGCGSTLVCGVCDAPLYCGGGGPENVCGCTPRTCESAGVSCGAISDGCGLTLACGSCGPPVLAPIGAQTVAVGDALTLQLAATDPDGDPLAFSAQPLPLPVGASLDGQLGLFTFRPGLEHVGTLELTFQVSDGTAVGAEAVTITVTGPGPTDPTTLSGQALDTNDFVTGINTPVVGATVSILGSGVSTTTDLAGNFVLSGVPAGKVVFDIDPSTAWTAPDGSTYAGFREALVLIANANNVIERPFFLPRIDPAGTAVVDPDQTTVVHNPNLGITIVVPPHTAKAPDGSDFTGALSISVVPDGLAPAALPPIYFPDPAITIQPVGVSFATPVPITWANVDLLAAGSQVDIYSLSPFTGQFSAVGTGQVSADGLRIETTSGGIRATDWHFILPPSASGGFAGGAGFCPKDSGSSTSLQSGALAVEHVTPDTISGGRSRAVRLVYASDQAAPRPVITTETTLLALGAVPPAVSIDSLTVGGLEVGGAIFTDTSGLSENVDETFRQVTSFDASGFATGAYRAVVGLTSHYPRSAIQATAADELVINNQRSSPVGAGWTIGGLARIHTAADGTVVMTDGERPARSFGRGTVTADVSINGQSNVFGAGKTSPPGGGLLPPLVALEGPGAGIDVEVTFPNVTGLVSGFAFGCAFSGPDGGLGCGGSTNVASSGAISGMIYNGATMFLAGVFIDDEVPANPAPPRIDYSDIGNTALDVFPELAQTFFIGDGRTGAGELQRFYAPTGATRLYLGFIETGGFNSGGGPGFYGDNGGVLNARVEYSAGSGALPRDFESPAGVFATLRQNADATFTLTQPDGTATHFDTVGLQTSRLDPNGNTTSWSYDGSGRVVSMTDPVGKVTGFAYAGGRLATITDPVGRVTALSHDGSGDLVGISSPDGSTRSFTYDARHRMTSQTNERGFTTAYGFDAFGHHRQTTRPDGSILSIGAANAIGLPDPASGIGTSSTPAPLIRSDEVFASLDETGRPPITFGVDTRSFVDRVTDSAGFTTSGQINDDGLAEGISFPGGNSVTSGYDAAGNRVSHADAVFGSMTQSVYEAPFNTLASLTDTDGTTQYSYAGPNLTARTSQLGRTTTFSHDARGNVLSVINPEGVESRIAYDADDNTVEVQYGPTGTDRIVATARSPEGYVAETTDPLGRTTSFTYDLGGRPTAQTLADGRVVTTGYDPAGNVSSITPPGRPAHQFAYTPTNRLARYSPPVVGPFDPDTHYEYNPAGQLTGVFAPDGRNVERFYDAFGRLETIVHPDDQVTFAYDPATGQASSISSADGTLTATYRGSVPDSVTYAFGFVSGSVTAQFDTEIRISQLTAGSAPTIAFAYDADGEIIAAGDLTIARDPLSGRVTSTTLGSTNDSWTYNPFGEPDAYQLVAGSSSLYSYDLSHDALGRIAEMLETVDGDTNMLVYSYDLTGRLESVTRDGVLVEQYGYDANDNRVTRLATTATFDNQDRLLSLGASTYNYTEGGDLASKTDPSGTTEYRYDAVGSLRGVTLPNGTVIDYLIDGQGRRIGKLVDGTPVRGWLYGDDLNPVAELDGAGNLISLFVYGTRSNVPEYMVRDGRTYRIASDRRGSVRLVVDVATGAIAARRDYDSLGNLTLDTDPDLLPFGFAGGLYDPDTGLVRFGARDYDPVAGRWTTRDPSLFAGGTNLFAYANSDPINFVDLTGRNAILLGRGGSSLISAEAGAAGALLLALGTFQQTSGVRGFPQCLPSSPAPDLSRRRPRLDPRRDATSQPKETPEPRIDPITPPVPPHPRRGCFFDKDSDDSIRGLGEDLVIMPGGFNPIQCLCWCPAVSTGIPGERFGNHREYHRAELHEGQNVYDVCEKKCARL